MQVHKLICVFAERRRSDKYLHGGSFSNSISMLQCIVLSVIDTEYVWQNPILQFKFLTQVIIFGDFKINFYHHEIFFLLIYISTKLEIVWIIETKGRWFYSHEQSMKFQLFDHKHFLILKITQYLRNRPSLVVKIKIKMFVFCKLIIHRMLIPIN